MLDPNLVRFLLTVLGYSACGSLAATIIRYRHRDTPGPRLDQVAAIGALVGAGFGALVAILNSLMSRV